MWCFSKGVCSKRGASVTFKVKRGQHHTGLISWIFHWKFFGGVFFSLCLFMAECLFFFSLSLISSLWYSPGKLDSPTHWPLGRPWKTKSLWVAKQTHKHILKWCFFFFMYRKTLPQCQWGSTQFLICIHRQTLTHTFSHFPLQLYAYCHYVLATVWNSIQRRLWILLSQLKASSGFNGGGRAARCHWPGAWGKACISFTHDHIYSI